MKKTLLTLALALSSTLIFAQRDIDWTIEEILLPTELRTTGVTDNPSNSTVINYKIACKNISDQDTVLPTDTFGIQIVGILGQNPVFAIPSLQTIALRRINRTVNPGDTVHISGSYTVGIRPNLSTNITLNFFSEVFNRNPNTGIPREATGTLANNTKTKSVIWYAPQGWGVNVNTLNTDVLSVYPNPTKDVLNINLNVVYANTKNTVEIVDLTGKVVMTETLNANSSSQVDVSSLEKGMYIVRVSNSENVFTSKVIID
ncbi:MAG: T9SS type A sorting domain-containing protein [Bacteroidota bacterium]|nr:T9SS type A sorting domain-containing protein [Bacteroidota bacterium]